MFNRSNSFKLFKRLTLQQNKSQQQSTYSPASPNNNYQTTTPSQIFTTTTTTTTKTLINEGIENKEEEQEYIITENNKNHNFNEKEMNDFKIVFRIFDTDNDGKISVNEFTQVLMHLGLTLSTIQLSKLFKKFSTIIQHQISYLSFDNFLSMLWYLKMENLQNRNLQQNNLQQEKNGQSTVQSASSSSSTLLLTILKQVFSSFDKNGDGFIDQYELSLVMYNLLGEYLPDDHIMAMIELGDKNKDGLLDFDEFTGLLSTI
ncbi:hypothetical protein ABK040_001998 [Willaertia magna]